MCGITGIYSRKGIDKEQVKKATDIMQHRGPDDSGFYFGNSIALGHRRLAIIDLSSKARQPMSNESGSMWIVYNGEIYNFQEIRKELEDKGHEFKSRCDSEVVLHAYEEWHEACLEKFNGMFAFAVWDEKKNELFLARDRAGIKPIYYWLDKERFVFASEIKAILEYGVPRELNKEILYDYFNYFILAGDNTLFKGIKTLPPAHYFILKEGKIRAKKYWDFDYKPENKLEDLWTKELREKISESVKKRLVSDVPVGAFISGGVDSSAIVSFMQQFSDKVKTFCVGSGDETELNAARFMAEKLNTDHHEVLVSAEDFAKNMENMIWHADMPMAWPSFVPLYFVSRLTKGKATVVLTGEGADELFAGYHRYYLMQKASLINKNIRFLGPINKAALAISKTVYQDVRYRKNLELLFDRFNFDYATGINIIIGDERDRLLNPQDIPRKNLLKEKVIEIFNRKQANFLNRLLYLDFKTYLVELLMKQDKMSMAASIESRVPFLDHNIVEFAASIPSSLKLNGRTGKYIFKKALHNKLPQSVIYQKKKGFPVPIERWFRHELNGFVKDNLQADNSVIKKFFNKNYLNGIIEKHKSRNYSLQLWALLNFKIWHEKFMIKND